MTQPQGIRNHIIFTFVDETTSTRFKNSHAEFIISSMDGNQAQAYRWGKVVTVGELCREVQPGDFILIEPGMWTPNFYTGSGRFWKTDETKVVAVADAPSTTY